MLSASVTADGRVRFYEDGEVREWPSVADLAVDYVRNVRLPDTAKEAADFRPWECVHDLTGPPAWSGAIRMIDALLAASDDERDLVMIATGPLWELITDPDEGPRFIDAIEARTRQDPQWRAAIAAVWLDRDGDTAVNRRLAVFGAHYPDPTRPEA